MDAQLYINYLTGIATLMNWISQQESEGYHFDYAPNQIIFNEQITRRFLIGVPHNKLFGKNPFIACQNPEISFLQFLNVSRVIIRDNDPYLHLIISGVAGDNIQFPNIAPFVLSLYVDIHDKISFLKSHALLDCRSFWIDDHSASNDIVISHHDILWTRPVIFLSEKSSLLDSEELLDGPSFKDLLSIKDQTLKNLKQIQSH